MFDGAGWGDCWSLKTVLKTCVGLWQWSDQLNNVWKLWRHWDSCCSMIRARRAHAAQHCFVSTKLTRTHCSLPEYVEKTVLYPRWHVLLMRHLLIFTISTETFWTVLHEDDSLRYVPPHDVTKRVSQIGSECINCNLIQDTSDYNWTLWHFVNIKIHADTTQAPRMVKYIWNISLQATLIIDWECREWLLLSTAALIPGWL